MSTVFVERVRQLNGEEKLPAFAEVEKTIEKIRQKAFSFFEERGSLPGLEWDDWLLAEHAVLGPSSAELLENDKELKLRIAVPGVEPREVTVTATPESLIVQANATRTHSGTDGEIRFCEFGEDKWCRQFSLPSRIDVNAVSASLDKGMLRIVASKATKSNAAQPAAA